MLMFCLGALFVVFCLPLIEDISKFFAACFEVLEVRLTLVATKIQKDVAKYSRDIAKYNQEIAKYSQGLEDEGGVSAIGFQVDPVEYYEDDDEDY